MSVKNEEYKKVAQEIDKPNIKEIINGLKEQKKQHLAQSKYHRDMSLKAEGAIDVLTQLDSKE